MNLLKKDFNVGKEKNNLFGKIVWLFMTQASLGYIACVGLSQTYLLAFLQTSSSMGGTVSPHATDDAGSTSSQILAESILT